MDNVGKAAVAEFIGTFALIFFGAGAIIMTGGQNLVAIALAHGLAIALMITIMGHISGGVFNPAIQIALWVTGKMPTGRSAVYIVAELLGGVAAAFFLKYIGPTPAFDAVKGGIPAVADGFAVGKAVVLEAMMTFFLVWAVFGTAVDDRKASWAQIAGFAIGLTITIDIFVGGALTGAAMNPARWFGPAVATSDYTNWWVWIVGPIAGGIIAGVAYWYLFLRGREPATP
ncbi:MAG TPA: aquaporin [Actinomycetota bacterium]|nr:aquaporin [Actinomycetota bacterium]